jgi:DNA-binding NtrC family response regulator
MGKGMTGADFLRFVKSNSPRTLRVLMTSGLGEDSLLEMMTKDFIDDYALKPVIAEHFLGQVEKSLKAYKNKT